MLIQGKEVKVYDNGGVSNDRYTVVIDNSVYALNAIPFHPSFGFSQYCGEVSGGYVWNEKWGHELHDISELPEEVVQAIVSRFEEELK
jgi:hypothetical protein